MPQIDPKIVEKVFVFFDATSVQFRRGIVLNSDTIKNERMSFAFRFLRRTLHCMKFIEFTTYVSNFRIFSFLENIVPILDLFIKLYFDQKPIGSGLKRVATGSILKRYQTSLFAQSIKTLLGNVNFDRFVKDLIFNRLRAKSLDLEYTIQRKTFRSTSWVRMA